MIMSSYLHITRHYKAFFCHRHSLIDGLPQAQDPKEYAVMPDIPRLYRLIKALEKPIRTRFTEKPALLRSRLIERSAKQPEYERSASVATLTAKFHVI
jgi:hypothetical protein